MRTSNPYLRDKAIREASGGVALDATNRMTVDGTTTKISILLLVASAVAALSWKLIAGGQVSPMPLMLGGAIGGLILSLVISFKPRLAPTLAIPFALCEGLMLGAVSLMYSVAAYPAIVLHAVLLTLGVSLSMFLLFRTGVIKVTDRMRSIVFAGMGAIFLVYMATFVLSFFGVSIPYIHGNGLIGIGFSAVVIVVVSFMLLIDFDMIQRMSQQGAPKAMEWYGAFALMVTLVWLYLEMLRLLSKLNSRN